MTHSEIRVRVMRYVPNQRHGRVNRIAYNPAFFGRLLERCIPLGERGREWITKCRSTSITSA
jgi:hypothetical protein